jgi:hypothetical protein
VDIQRAAVHRREEWLGDAVAVRGPDQELGSQREDRGYLSFIKARRLSDRQPHGARGYLHRGLAQHPARCGTIGLGHHSGDLNDAVLAKTVERLERTNRELGRAEEKSALC